eukprot:500624-Rhodomonas_salina.1
MLGTASGSDVMPLVTAVVDSKLTIQLLVHGKEKVERRRVGLRRTLDQELRKRADNFCRERILAAMVPQVMLTPAHFQVHGTSEGRYNLQGALELLLCVRHVPCTEQETPKRSPNLTARRTIKSVDPARREGTTTFEKSRAGLRRRQKGPSESCEPIGHLVTRKEKPVGRLCRQHIC